MRRATRPQPWTLSSFPSRPWSRWASHSWADASAWRDADVTDTSQRVVHEYQPTRDRRPPLYSRTLRRQRQTRRRGTVRSLRGNVARSLGRRNPSRAGQASFRGTKRAFQTVRSRGLRVSEATSATTSLGDTVRGHISSSYRSEALQQPSNRTAANDDARCCKRSRPRTRRRTLCGSVGLDRRHHVRSVIATLMRL